MSKVFVVMEVVSINSVKVTDIVELTDTDVPEGEVEATVGAVVSVVVVLEFSVYSSSSSLQEVMVRLKQVNAKKAAM